MVTPPPVPADEKPAERLKPPPAPELPPPTASEMAPPAPLDEPPVVMPTDPLLPFVETPLLIEIDPLTPDVPASALRIDIVPELAYPDPLTMLTLPPAAPTVVASDDDPEAK